jgi:hypothetical protein
VQSPTETPTTVEPIAGEGLWLCQIIQVSEFGHMGTLERLSILQPTAREENAMESFRR